MCENKKDKVDAIKNLMHDKWSKKYIESHEFILDIKNYKFESENQVEELANLYRRLVWTRDVRAAIFFTLPVNPPIQSLKLQHSIARGMRKKHIVDQFDYDEPPRYPKWYFECLESFKSRNNTSNQKNDPKGNVCEFFSAPSEKSDSVTEAEHFFPGEQNYF